MTDQEKSKMIEQLGEAARQLTVVIDSVKSIFDQTESLLAELKPVVSSVESLARCLAGSRLRPEESQRPEEPQPASPGQPC